MKRVLISGFATGAIAVLLLAGCQSRDVPRDETDSPTHRSGVSIVTDYGTGCQYLVTPRYNYSGGGITPRLSPDGKPICRPQQTAMPQLRAWSPNKKVAI